MYMQIAGGVLRSDWEPADLIFQSERATNVYVAWLSNYTGHHTGHNGKARGMVCILLAGSRLQTIIST
jgi:hypothetical protein